MHYTDTDSNIDKKNYVQIKNLEVNKYEKPSR